MKHQLPAFLTGRRNFLRSGLYGMAVSTQLPLFLQNTSRLMAAESASGKEKSPGRIMVVVELNGGNDGLNTVVPYGHDEYYQNRPKLGIPQKNLLKIDEQFGFHPALGAFHRLFKDGKMAVVHGCSYPNPDRSHFVAMEYWHTATPHQGATYGWIGRFADASSPQLKKNYIVNISTQQAFAVRSAVHAPIVFNVPEEFERRATMMEKPALNEIVRAKPSGGSALNRMQAVWASAADGADAVKAACAAYQTPVDYGPDANTLGADLRKVAALIAAGLETRIFYVSLGGFDTHATQLNQHQTLLSYAANSVEGFLKDLERLGRRDDVAIMMFTEFGRRVSENGSAGTDHGVATPMYIFGNHVRGGFYGKFPSFTDLDQGDLKMTTDFRSVYATMIKEWMGYGDTKTILKGEFPTLGVFAG